MKSVRYTQTHGIGWVLLEVAEGAGHTHFKVILYHPWKVMTAEGGS